MKSNIYRTSSSEELNLNKEKEEFTKQWEEMKWRQRSFGEILNHTLPDENYKTFAAKTQFTETAWARYTGEKYAHRKPTVRTITTIAVACHIDLMTVMDMCKAAGVGFNYYRMQDAAYLTILRLCEKHELDTNDCNVILKAYGLKENELLESIPRKEKNE